VTIFTFDATSSSDEEDLPATLLVRWDWESDGIFDTDYSTNKSLDHQYTGVGNIKSHWKLWNLKIWAIQKQKL
jgi:hypothetical protein